MTKKNQTELEDLIKAFYFNDSQKKEYSAIAEEEKARIKAIMQENEITDYIVGDLKAKYITSVTENFNEDMLLDVLKKHGLDGCIKTVEVVDMDALENAIYHHEVPNSVLKKMDDCRNTKTVISLKVTKVKNEKMEG